MPAIIFPPDTSLKNEFWAFYKETFAQLLTKERNFEIYLWYCLETFNFYSRLHLNITLVFLHTTITKMRLYFMFKFSYNLLLSETKHIFYEWSLNKYKFMFSFTRQFCSHTRPDTILMSLQYIICLQKIITMKISV